MSLQAGVVPRVSEEIHRWRAAGIRRILRAALPFVLAAALLKLSISDGGRHPSTLTAIQILVFAVGAILVAAGALRSVAGLWPLAAVVLATALSGIWSVRPDSTLRELLLWTSYLGVFSLVSSSLIGWRAARYFLDAVLVIGAWLSLIGLYIFWGTGDPRLRWYSTFYAPNAFAAFLLLVLPIAATRYCLARNRREALDYGAVSVLLGTALTLTVSTGAYIALGLTTLVAALILRPTRWAMIRRFGIGVAVTALAVTLLTHTSGTVLRRTSEVLDAGSSSIQDRLSFWRGGFRIFADHPWTGTGPGTFAFVYGKYQDRYYSRDAHNLYVQMLAEAGLLGTLPFMVFLGSLAALWLQALRNTRKREEFPLVAGAGLSLLAFFLDSGVEMNWQFPANPALALALAGMLAASEILPVAAVGRQAPKAASHPLVRGAMVLVFLAAIGAATILQLADGEFSRGRRLVAAREWPGASRAFARAMALNPLDPKAPSAQAVVAQALHQPVKADALIRDSMALDRMNAYYPLQLAELLLPRASDSATSREVEQLFLRAIELDPFHYPEGYRRLAQHYAGQGRIADAQAVYARAGRIYGARPVARDPVLRFRLWPRVAALFSEWATFTASRGTADAAVAVLDELLRQDPTWQPAYRQIADLYLRDDRPREAVAALVAGWAERPDSLAQAPRPSRLSAFFPRVYPR